MRRGSAAAGAKKELDALTVKLFDTAQAQGSIICHWRIGGDDNSRVSLKGTVTDILMAYGELAAYLVTEGGFPMESVAMAVSAGIAAGLAAKQGLAEGESPHGMLQ